MKHSARGGACPAPFSRRKNGAGQAMLIATLALGGAILGVTTIAGLLILYQIQGTTESQHSARAIFAADSGVEWALFDFYCELASPPRCTQPPEPPLPGCSGTPGTFCNGATVSVTCYNDSGTATTDCNNRTAASAISKGTSLASKRAFFVGIATATSTFP